MTTNNSTIYNDVAAVVAAAAQYVTDTLVASSTLATLVADGASPTQAHVTAHSNAVITQVADYATLTSAISTLATDHGLHCATNASAYGLLQAVRQSVGGTIGAAIDAALATIV